MRLKLSRQGRRSLKAGLDGESLEMTLLMEVMKHVDEDISEENLCSVLDELVARCGSIENAIIELKTGKCRIEKARDDEDDPPDSGAPATRRY